ncbi:hypothetical protein ACOBQJ_05075 [Pelotomaculum propionicicum]
MPALTYITIGGLEPSGFNTMETLSATWGRINPAFSFSAYQQLG